MFTKEYLENLDVPCQYIAGKKDVCTVVRSNLEAIAIIAEVYTAWMAQVDADKWRDGMNEVIAKIEPIVKGGR